MAVIRGLDKRGDPRKPFTRRPDFCYLGNFTSCLLGFGAAGQVRSLAGTAGRLVFSRGLAAQVADLHRVTEVEWVCQRTRRFALLPETRSLDKSTVQGPIPVQLHLPKAPSLLRTDSFRGLRVPALKLRRLALASHRFPGCRHL
jgi:hypothetical protein